MPMSIPTGLVLEGGGMRTTYTAGVLDAFLDAGVDIGYVIGVSAGANAGSDYVVGSASETTASSWTSRRTPVRGLAQPAA